MSEAAWLVPNVKGLLCGFRRDGSPILCREVHPLSTSHHVPAIWPECRLELVLPHYGATRDQLVPAADKPPIGHYVRMEHADDCPQHVAGRNFTPGP